MTVVAAVLGLPRLLAPPVPMGPLVLMSALAWWFGDVTEDRMEASILAAWEKVLDALAPGIRDETIARYARRREAES